MSGPVASRITALLGSLARPPRSPGDIGEDTPLFEAGLALDSASVLELVVAIEEQLGVELAAAEVADRTLRTVGDLIELVAKRAGG